MMQQTNGLERYFREALDQVEEAFHKANQSFNQIMSKWHDTTGQGRKGQVCAHFEKVRLTTRFDGRESFKMTDENRFKNVLAVL